MSILISRDCFLWTPFLFLYLILATLPITSSGFAAIGCYRAALPLSGVSGLRPGVYLQFDELFKIDYKKFTNFFLINPNVLLTKTELTKEDYSNLSIRSGGDRF